MEIWRSINGYEGIYQVSNYGRIKSLGNDKSKKEKILKTNTSDRGYIYLDLHNSKKIERFRIHRLVAETFVPNPNNYTAVHHIDYNPKNNCSDNLVWMDEEEHKKLHGINGKEVYQYTLDGKLVQIWHSTSECGKYGFSIGAISECCSGKRKTYKGFKWLHTRM